MDNTTPGGGAKFGFNLTKTAADTQISDNVQSPVEDNINKPTDTNIFDNGDNESVDTLNSSYTDISSVSISLVKTISHYRRMNDKTLPKKTDYIGGSISASRILSSDEEEVKAYFPNLIGLAPNNADFVSRVKQYLNNIRVAVDELGVTFNTSFIYKKKSDYYKIKDRVDHVEDVYLKSKGQDLSRLKAALKEKIITLNIIETEKHKYGRPVNVEDYIMYRHCLLYGDVAKDMSLINSDSSIRFYFKDDRKEADKAKKFRIEIVKAKANYVTALSDNTTFNSIYTQFLVATNQPVISGNLENQIDKEIKLDKYSTDEPVKFNKLFNNKDVELIGNIELLIAHGELQRSQYNQNITTSDGQFIGSNIGEAIHWFKNPDNTSTVNSYINKLRNI